MSAAADGRRLIAVGWALAASLLAPPVIAGGIAPIEGAWMWGLELAVWVVSGGVLGLALAHAVGLAALAVALRAWVDREPRPRAPLPVAPIAAPALAHLALLGVAKAVAAGFVGTFALVPLEAWLQWLWVAPAVTALAWNPARPLALARARALLGAAGFVVLLADVTIAVFVLALR